MKGQGRDLGMEAEERKGRNRPESEGGARIQKGEREKTRGRQLGDLAPFGDAVLGPQRITTVYAKTGHSMPSSKTAMHVRSGDVLEMRPAPAKAYSFRNCVLTSLPGDQESQEWDGWGGGSKHRWPRSSAGKDSFI